MQKKYYEIGGPVYLLLEGEEDADPGWMNVGLWSSHGRDNSALLFYLEHRFYGLSRPTKWAFHCSIIKISDAGNVREEGYLLNK